MSSIIKIKKRGLTLVEMVIYVALTALIITVATETFWLITRSYRLLQSSQQIEQAATIGLERLVRETRGSISVDLGQSVLNSSPGRLVLNTTDDAGALTTTDFFLTGQSLRLKLGGVDQGTLLPATVRATSLVYRLLSSGRSQAVKIELTLESGSGQSLRTKNFYTTVVLRGSYAPS